MKIAIPIAVVCLVLTMVTVGMLVALRNQRDVTQEEYGRLKEGMTHAEVIALLGRDGQPTTRLEHYVLLALADTRRDYENAANYTWSNRDGSGILLTFDGDDRLLSKNVPRLDKPGIMTLAFELDGDGRIANRAAIEAVLGDEAADYIRLGELAAQESPVPDAQ